MIFVPRVRDYMSPADSLPQPLPQDYTVAPDMRIDDVALAMAEKKVPVALVVGANGTTLGIFTVYDGLRALGEWAHREETGVVIDDASCGLAG